jgi:hypothetical protein
MPVELPTIRTSDEKLAALTRELGTLSNVELLLYFWRHLAWRALARGKFFVCWRGFVLSVRAAKELAWDRFRSRS